MATIGNGLQLFITEDVNSDGFITADEASGLVGLRGILPPDAIVGDRIVVTDSLGNQGFKVLDAADIAAGELAGDVFGLPANGQTLTVTAEIITVDGTVRASTSASAVVQLSPPGGGITEPPVVEIIEDSNQDGRIDGTELSGLIGARVTLPAGAVVGDTLVAVDQTGFTVSKVLDANDIANGSLQGDVFNAPADGQVFSLSVTIVNAFGESSPAGVASVVMGLGGGEPPSVTLDQALDTVGAVQGDVADGGLTDTGLLIFSGTGVAGTAVEIQDAGIAIGTTVVDENGTWRWVPLQPLSDGAHQITAVALDALGNPGTPSAARSFTVDSVPPSAPTVVLLNDTDDNQQLSEVEQAGSTSANLQIGLPADAQAGDLLVLIDQAGTRVEQVLSAADILAGSLVINGAFALPPKGQPLLVQAGIQNAAGNLSELASDGALVVGPPSAPPVVEILSDANGDGFIERSEADGALVYRVVLPADATLDASLEVSWSVGAQIGTQVVPVTAAMLADGFVLLGGGNPGDPPQPALGETVSIEAVLSNALGQVSEVGVASAVGALNGAAGVDVNIYKFDDPGNPGAALGGGQSITFFGNPGTVAALDGSLAIDLAGGASGQYGDITGMSVSGGAMSVAANVRFDTTGAWQRVFDFGQTTSGGIGNIYVGRLAGSDSLTFTIEKNGQYVHRATAVGAITNGEWLNFVATVDDNGLMQLYVNGALAATTQGVALETGVRDNYFIGKSAWGSDAAFDGAVDNLVILDTALTAQQAAELAGYAVVAVPDLGSAVAQAQAGGTTFYYGADEGSFGVLNVDTGVRTVLGKHSTGLLDIAMGVDGSLYALATNGDLLKTAPVSDIVGQASLTRVGNVPGAGSLTGALDGLLYAVRSSDGTLMSINPVNGATTNLANLGATGGGDLVQYNNAFYWAAGNGTIVKYDLATGAVSTAVTGVPANFYNLGLNGDGSMYGVADTGLVYTINVDQGTISATGLALTGPLITGLTSTSLNGQFSAAVSGDVTPNSPLQDTDPSGGLLSVVGVVAGEAAVAQGSVGNSIRGEFGELKMQADGTYTYAADNSLTATQNLPVGTSALDVFSYTVRSADSGSAATTTLSIEVSKLSATMATPLVLDLDGNGVQTTGLDNAVVFDIDADGTADRTGWVDTNDGLLVLDRNGDGTINDGSELFGDATPLPDGSTAAEGFAALASMDSNGDGVVNAADDGFANLQLWVDANHDGISQAAELNPLSAFGITELSLASSMDGSTQSGNMFGLSGQFSTADGGQGAMVDVLFSTEAVASTPALTELLDGATADGMPAVTVDELVGGGAVLSATLAQADDGPICYSPNWTPQQLETGAEVVCAF